MRIVGSINIYRNTCGRRQDSRIQVRAELVWLGEHPVQHVYDLLRLRGPVPSGCALAQDLLEYAPMALPFGGVVAHTRCIRNSHPSRRQININIGALICVRVQGGLYSQIPHRHERARRIDSRAPFEQLSRRLLRIYHNNVLIIGAKVQHVAWDSIQR